MTHSLVEFAVGFMAHLYCFAWWLQSAAISDAAVAPQAKVIRGA